MSVTLTIHEASEPIAHRFTSALARRGAKAVRSFDLRSARAASTCQVPCPYHPTTDCSCQYVILIVYAARDNCPRTIVLHEFEGTTRVTLDDADEALIDVIRITRGNG